MWIPAVFSIYFNLVWEGCTYDERNWSSARAEIATTAVFKCLASKLNGTPRTARSSVGDNENIFLMAESGGMVMHLPVKVCAVFQKLGVFPFFP